MKSDFRKPVEERYKNYTAPQKETKRHLEAIRGEFQYISPGFSIEIATIYHDQFAASKLCWTRKESWPTRDSRWTKMLKVDLTSQKFKDIQSTYLNSNVTEPSQLDKVEKKTCMCLKIAAILVNSLGLWVVGLDNKDQTTIAVLCNWFFQWTLSNQEDDGLGACRFCCWLWAGDSGTKS